MLAAYELQAAEIARSKADGLRAHYGLDAEGTAFWDVHAALEAEHADVDARRRLATSPAADVLDGVAASRDAWWSFLDEREAEASLA